MIGILSQNSFNDFNETNVGCLSGLNERNIILFDYIRFLHISTAPLPWNPPANDSCPEWSRGHPLLYWPHAPHHHPQFLQGCAPQDDDWLVWQLGPRLSAFLSSAVSARTIQHVCRLARIVLKKMNICMLRFRTRWESAEMSVYKWWWIGRYRYRWSI